LEWFFLPLISRGGYNPFGSLASFDNSRPRMEFGEARIGSNKETSVKEDLKKVLYMYTSCASSF
jgi:hypothetical protein